MDRPTRKKKRKDIFLYLFIEFFFFVLLSLLLCASVVCSGVENSRATGRVSLWPLFSVNCYEIIGFSRKVFFITNHCVSISHSFFSFPYVLLWRFGTFSDRLRTNGFFLMLKGNKKQKPPKKKGEGKTKQTRPYSATVVLTATSANA